MADFVAVIRRAVDGLTENTPEMRVRVYEKARSAVVRQLENMNPRPPEAMFKRQLDKLDDAIHQVEQEHAEAAPADAAPVEAGLVEQPAVEQAAVAQPVVAQAVEPAAVEATPVEKVAEPVQEPAVAELPQHQAVMHEEPAHREEPVAFQAEPVRHEPVYEEQARQEPVARVEPEVHHEPAPALHAEPEITREEPRHVEEPVAYSAEPVREEQPVQSVDAHHDPLLSHFHDSREREAAVRHHAANWVMEEPHVDHDSEFPGMDQAPAQADAHHRAAAHDEQSASRPVAAMPSWGVDIDREPEQAPEVQQEEPAPQMPRAALTETDVATGFNDFVKNELATPAVPPPARKENENDFSWDAPFDDLPDLPKPVAFNEALHARQEEMAKAPETKADPRRDARAELEDLIGYAPANDAADRGDKLSPDVARGMSKLEGKSFKVNRKNKQKFNPYPIAFGVVAALIVAGGAFGAYTYREDVTKLVASYMPAETTPEKVETRDVAAKTEDQTKNIAVKTDDAAATDTKPAADTEKPTEVASLDPSIVPSKFTQRLMVDGSETETDAAKVPVDQSLTEGKTIAGQTVAPETEVAANETSTTNTTTTTDAAANTEGLVAAQKMILYEERLGDSPVAVQGKVTWKLKTDTSNASGKEQPMVEATVEVPERKLKAIVSFKRNADVSLPASHIIEVVFDLPDNFPEGNVESVQRIAFKQTEQDRGNSLIAVPAKITDDFHMIALNDDAEARKVNVELMKTRSWIDIPVVYRNNRRALLTFEKGSTGTEAFDKALAAWAALGPTATSD